MSDDQTNGNAGPDKGDDSPDQVPDTPASPDAAPDMTPDVAPDILDPPTTIGGTLLRLGPGMIIAGSIVGSGELIMTTKTGAMAGFVLLWLILIGCVIKVFAQVEVGRYTIAWSQTSLSAFNQVPGPRYKVNWIVWSWFIVTLLVLTQQGGIVGGVGQALTIRFPITEQGKQYNELQDQWIKKQVELGQLYKKHPKIHETGSTIPVMLQLQQIVASPDSAPDDVKIADAGIKQVLARRNDLLGTEVADEIKAMEVELLDIKTRVDKESDPYDAYIWATILGVGTAILLYVGKYGLIQAASTIFVGLFTIITVFTLIMLQMNPDWRVTGGELVSGFTLQSPRTPDPAIVDLLNLDSPIFIALAAFGIIGVGATELMQYPYWCLEKGYAQHTGPYDDTPQWAARARGWMRVMRIDAWLSMVVYTFATVAFYLLGAAVLGRTGLNPGGKDLIRTLMEMYVPVFGDWAPIVFLFGAFAVLYSTYFVASAGNARMIADVMGLFGITEHNEETRKRWTRILSAVWPMLAVAIFWIVGWLMKGQNPAAMVLLAGIGGAILLPMVGVGALWFRYRRCVDALRPGKLWDLMLWISFVGFVVTGAVALYKTIDKAIG